MAENTNYQQPDKTQEEGIDIKEWFFKCLEHWPWFVVSVACCVILAFVYLQFQMPKYNVSASVLVKEKEKRSATSTPLMMSAQSMGMLSMTSSFDNEVEILQSRTLVKNVIINLKRYIISYKPRAFGYDIPLYRNEPVVVYATPEDAAKFIGSATLKTQVNPDASVDINLKYMLDGKPCVEALHFDSLPAVVTTQVGAVISLTKGESFQSALEAEGRPYKMLTRIMSPITAARIHTANLAVAASSKQTSIANISFKCSNKRYGVDFINCLVDLYNVDANNEKNMVAEATAKFINERILIIDDELSSTDRQIADFKQRAGLTDLSSEAQLALEENSRYQQMFTEVNTQITLVEYLRDYMSDHKHVGEIVPSNVGLTDKDLSTVIEQYNSLVIERKRLLLTSSESNPAVVSVSSAIETMYQMVETSVGTVLNGLLIRKSAIEKESGTFQTRITQAPENEKEFLSISRQQEIKAALYTLLLQKREENAITLSATANNGRIIAEALADNAPVAPKKSMILLVALVLGCCLPIAFIYVSELLKYKIEDREDVEKITNLPVLAELPDASKEDRVKGMVMVHENRNNLMEEAFRALRTQLLFMLEKGEKVVLISSSQPGEGKSTIAANLSASLAYMGKKVLVIGADIRKPGLNKAFDFPTKERGLSNYLNDPEGININDLIFTSDLSDHLDILPGGTVPPNPTELVTRQALDTLVASLKERYDYIILDTAPIALVPDTAIIARVADLCLYVCRSGVTTKKALGYLNTLQRQKNLKKCSVVVNDVSLSRHKYKAYYGYGKGSYGYGYGYGYNDDENAGNKRKHHRHHRPSNDKNNG